MLLVEMRRYPKTAERIRIFINARAPEKVFISTRKGVYTYKFNMDVAVTDLFQCINSCNRSVLRWKCIKYTIKNIYLPVKTGCNIVKACYAKIESYLNYYCTRTPTQYLVRFGNNHSEVPPLIYVLSLLARG